MTRIATVQFAPVYLDWKATATKMADLAKRAANDGAELVVFPECACSMYPNWVPDPFSPKSSIKEVGEFGDYYRRYLDAATTIPGGATDILSKVAKESGVCIVTGIVERHAGVRGTLWNSSVVIDRSGEIVGTHRKLTPVNHERMYFAFGGAEDVRVFDTSVGRIGVGICFENMNPLYNHMLVSLGEEVHCALWASPGPKKGQAGAYSAEGYIKTLAVAYAIQFKTVVVASSLVTPEGQTEGFAEPSWCHIGVSLIVSPRAEILAQVDRYTEGYAMAEVDLRDVGASRMEWNPFGKEERSDLFEVRLKGSSSEIKP